MQDLLEKARAVGSSQWFLNTIPLIWDTSQRYGLRPEVMAAIVSHETNRGKFTGMVPMSYNNPAGIKVRNPQGDRPEDHAQFRTIEEGIEALAQHMSAYAGLPLPHGTKIIDPRYVWVGPGSDYYGQAKTVDGLTDRWAPTRPGQLSYGELIYRHIEELT